MRRLFLAVALAALAGCVETRGTRVTIDTDAGAASVLENSYRLANRVKVTRCTYGDNGHGIRRATVTIESQTKRRQRLQMRMIWLDADGVEIDADAKPYRAVILDGNDTHSFTGYSPRPDGRVAKVQIREIETVE
ncbi:MAG: DUF1425 domain-containing protein [Kiritimatiellia bacterium]